MPLICLIDAGQPSRANHWDDYDNNYRFYIQWDTVLISNDDTVLAVHIVPPAIPDDCALYKAFEKEFDNYTYKDGTRYFEGADHSRNIGDVIMRFAKVIDSFMYPLVPDT